jgi:RimJ/RimL family protein N-acetyltransferase
MVDETLRLRLAKPEDCELLFRWVNDAVTRRMSTSSREITRPEHVEWFRQKLQDPGCFMYIVTHSQQAVGQVRFDVDSTDCAVVSVSIAPDCRGYGYAAEAIRVATATIRASVELRVIHAFIKPDNQTSVRAFARAGYRAPVQVQHRGQDMLCMSDV